MRVRTAFCLVYEARLSDCARNAEHGAELRFGRLAAA
jgi:hypothetical protein